jgi:hypothetical protein
MFFCIYSISLSQSNFKSRDEMKIFNFMHKIEIQTNQYSNNLINILRIKTLN